MVWRAKIFFCFSNKYSYFYVGQFISCLSLDLLFVTNSINEWLHLIFFWHSHLNFHSLFYFIEIKDKWEAATLKLVNSNIEKKIGGIYEEDFVNDRTSQNTFSKLNSGYFVRNDALWWKFKCTNLLWKCLGSAGLEWYKCISKYVRSFPCNFISYVLICTQNISWKTHLFFHILLTNASY